MAYYVGLRHIIHIIHLIETTVLYILPDIWEDGKNGNFIITIPSDISYLKEPTDFFIKLRRYTAIGNQLLISNDKNRVRCEVLWELNRFVLTFQSEQLKARPASNNITGNRPLFSITNTFKESLIKKKSMKDSVCPEDDVGGVSLLLLFRLL